MDTTHQPSRSASDLPGQAPPPHPAIGIGRPGIPADPADVVALERWFDRLAEERTHPTIVAARLRRAGWDDPAVTWADRRYRGRWSSHPAVWWGGFTAIGMAALAVAGVLHSLIDDHRDTAASWFGLAIVALAFGAVGTVLMNRLADDWTQRFSAPRRSAATVLFWSAIAVAVVRGLVYGQTLGHELLIGDHCRTEFDWAEATGQPTETEVCVDRGADALGHLALTVVIATPIACWAWYGHRKPTDPPAEAGLSS